MLVPGEQGSRGIHTYVFTVESQQTVGARHTSCTQLLWKPQDPSREDTHIYLITFEKSRYLGAKEHFMYPVTVETLRSGQARHARLSTYRGNLKNVYEYVLQYLSGARSYRKNTNNMYVCIYYTVVLVPGEPLRC
jgi:hypothetical protein